MLAPIELIKATLDGMIARRFGRIVNITSSAVRMPIETLGLSNGARAGLTGFVAGLARQVARHNVTINNLLPGQTVTDRLKKTTEGAAKAAGVSFDELWERRLKNIPAQRMAIPRNSAHCARSYAAPRLATSSDRTFCTTVARIPAPCRS
jgi:3-oxoacyl-[acyl-carrier protein] reductase